MAVFQIPGKIDKGQHDRHINNPQKSRGDLAGIVFRISKNIYKQDQDQRKDHCHHAISSEIQSRRSVVEKNPQTRRSLQQSKPVLMHIHRAVQFFCADHGNTEKDSPKHRSAGDNGKKRRGYQKDPANKPGLEHSYSSFTPPYRRSLSLYFSIAFINSGLWKSGHGTSVK